MIIECWTIIILLTAVALIYIRAKRRHYALGILSMTIIPLFHVLGYGIVTLTLRFTNVPAVQIRTVIDILALPIASVILVVLSGKIRSKKVRAGFIAFCGGFMLILSCILILSLQTR